MSQMSLRRSNRLQRRSPSPRPSLRQVDNRRARPRGSDGGGRVGSRRDPNGADGPERAVRDENNARDGDESPGGARSVNNGNGNHAPPPPPPNLAEVMAQQTQLMAALVQGMNRRNDGGGRHGDF